MFKVDLTVSPKAGVMDPQAEAVEQSLGGIGYEGVKVHAVGRRLSMTLDCADEAAARALADKMCVELLVNPNLETYELHVEKAG